MTAAPRSEPIRVLVADDDVDLLELIAFYLFKEGFYVLTALDGASALEIFANVPVSLAVVDRDVPGTDGLTVCKTVRARSSTPVIILSGSAAEHDVLYAFESGADDYLTKPVSPRTLLARVQALLRRAQARKTTVIEFGDTVLDVRRNVVQSAGRDIRLTSLETQVLKILLSNAGCSVSAAGLSEEVWGRAGQHERNALKQVVYRLRHKLAHDADARPRLETLRGLGYRWAVS